MNEIKKTFNKILVNKVRNMPRVLRKNNMNECRDLIMSYKAQIDQPTKDLFEEDPYADPQVDFHPNQDLQIETGQREET